MLLAENGPNDIFIRLEAAERLKFTQSVCLDGVCVCVSVFVCVLATFY